VNFDQFTPFSSTFKHCQTLAQRAIFSLTYSSLSINMAAISVELGALGPMIQVAPFSQGSG
jgi:hypothetical protein